MNLSSPELFPSIEKSESISESVGSIEVCILFDKEFATAFVINTTIMDISTTGTYDKHITCMYVHAAPNDLILILQPVKTTLEFQTLSLQLLVKTKLASL